jgi:hypothetical protein
MVNRRMPVDVNDDVNDDDDDDDVFGDKRRVIDSCSI